MAPTLFKGHGPSDPPALCVPRRDKEHLLHVFNRYACVMSERWLDGVQDEGCVGTQVLYELDQQLFRRSTKNARETIVHARG